MITVDLVRLAASQRAMPWLGQFDRERGTALMAAMDSCNARRGRGAVVPAAAGVAPRRGWATKFEMRSPRYTTRLAELPMVGHSAGERPASWPPPGHGRPVASPPMVRP